MPVAAPSDAQLTEALKSARRIAVVGLSTDPVRDSNRVATYLADAGYDVVGVNPVYAGEDVAGIPIVETLDEAGDPDMVDVFRRSGDIPPVARQVLAMDPRPKTFWMQLGIRHPASAQELQDAGLFVVQDECAMVEHGRLIK